jgi:Concanavalin A-like lectin/glucanases superfamily
MHDPIIIAAPLLIAAIVMGLRFVGCSLDTEGELSPTPYSGVVIAAPGVVSFWRLNETAGDKAADSTDGNNGTYQNVSQVTLGVDGLANTDTDNTAASFDGGSGDPTINGGYVSVPFNANVNPAKFTVEALVNPSAVGTGDANDYHAVVSARDIDAGKTSGYILYLHGSDFEAWVGTGTATWAPAVVVKAGVKPNTGPFYLAMTYDGSTLSLFVNPTADTLADITSNDEEFAQATVTYVKNTTTQLRIGAGANEQVTPTYCFPGVIGDVAIYSDALSYADILQHFTVAMTGFS